MNYLIHLLILVDIYIIVAMSLNLVVGYCGMLTLAHAVYFAIGGYGYAILSLKFGLGFFPATLIAACVAMLLSLALSLPAWRLKGDFLVLGNLAVQFILFSVIYNWIDANAPIGSFKNLTNGPFGIVAIPHATVFGLEFRQPSEFLWLATGVAVICIYVCWRLTKSPWGRVLISMREDELAARSLGKNTRFLKVEVFAASCGLVAVGGAMYAAYMSYLDPSSASLDESILMLSMVIVGGAGNFRGPLIGAIVLIAIPELLRFVQIPDAVAANLRLGVYGLLLVLMMHFRPQGICGEYRMT